MKLELDDVNTAAYLVGYTTKQAVKKDSKYNTKLTELLKSKFNIHLLRKIYKQSIITLDSAMFDDDIAKLTALTSHYLILIDSIEKFNNDEINYYYVLGFTSPALDIADDKSITINTTEK